MSDVDRSPIEKRFTFISDPNYQETLSGRVRIACVTCRRRKTKCFGSFPCITCKDRGLECEGLVERKRRKERFGQQPHIRAPATKLPALLDKDIGLPLQASLVSNADSLRTTNRNIQSSQRLISDSEIDSTMSKDGLDYADTLPPRSTYTRIGPDVQADTTAEWEATFVNSSHDAGLFRHPQSLQAWDETHHYGSTNYISGGVSDLGLTLDICKASEDILMHSSTRVRDAFRSDTHTDREVSKFLMSAARVLEEQAWLLRQFASQYELRTAEGA